MKLIFLDMDGVLTPIPHPIQLAEMIGRADELYEISKGIFCGTNGRIGLEWIVKEMAKVFLDVPETALEDAGKRLPVMRGASETIRELKKGGYHPILITSGFEQVAGVFAHRLGITEWYGNALEVKNGKTTGRLYSLTLASLHSKGDLVRKMVAHRSSKRESVAVGNDVNDFSMFQEVGFSILFNVSSNFDQRLPDCLNIEEKGFRKGLIDFSRNVDIVIKEPDLRLLIPFLVPEPNISGTSYS